MIERDSLVELLDTYTFLDGKIIQKGALAYVNSVGDEIAYIQPVDPPENEQDFEWVVLLKDLKLVEKEKR